MRTAARSAWTALPLLLGLSACLGAGMRTTRKEVVAAGREFFDHPGRFKGRSVRLVNLSLLRAEITRPLVLAPEGLGAPELVVNDGRQLASQQGLKQGDRVTLLVDCTEGRLERGNLLLELDPYPPR